MDPTWYAMTKWYNNLKTRGNGGKNLARRLVRACPTLHYIHHKRSFKPEILPMCCSHWLNDWKQRYHRCLWSTPDIKHPHIMYLVVFLSVKERKRVQGGRWLTLEVYRAIGDDEGVASATTNIASAKSMYEVTNGATQVWGQKPRSDASRDQGYHCQWKIGES